MNCKQFQKYIPQFFAEELNIEETESFLLHVANCKECAEELETMHLLEVGLLQLDSDGRDENYDFKRLLKEKLDAAAKRCRKAHRARKVHNTIVALANITAVIGMIYQAFMMFGGVEWLENYF